MAEGSTPCGPFRSADDSTVATCGLAVTLDHPQQEAGIEYDVEVTYPAADGERTMRRFTFCTSDGDTASCEQ